MEGHKLKTERHGNVPRPLVSQLLESTSSPSAFPHFTSAHMAKWLGAFCFRKPDRAKLQTHLTPVLAAFLHGSPASLPSQSRYLSTKTPVQQNKRTPEATKQSTDRKYRFVDPLSFVVGMLAGHVASNKSVNHAVGQDLP